MDLISQIFFNIVPFLLVLSVLVYVHEMGHYLAAKSNGIKVEAFSIGFGKEIFGWTNKHGTRWKICWFPIGGYVKMHGESADESVKKKKDTESFSNKTPLQRIIVAAAGPFANYVYAILMLCILYSVTGQRIPVSLTVNGVEESSLAQKHGLQKNDTIVGIGEKNTINMQDLQVALSTLKIKNIVLNIIRDNKSQVVNIPITEADNAKLGVKLLVNYNYKKLSIISSCKHSFLYAMNFTAQTLNALSSIITGKVSTDGLVGPIGIANLTAQFAQQGVMALLWLSIILSLNLGLINLFPLPVLDGGHILFCLVEMIKGKPVSEKTQEIAYKIGGYALLALFVFTTWKDLHRLKIVQSLLNLFN